MTLQWYVVKYVPDLVRREPRNIGVILVGEGDLRLSRFLGETDDGEIDGRTVPQFGNHLVYKAWVRQWRQLRDEGVQALAHVARAGRGSSFYVEEGGRWLVGPTPGRPDELLADLYSGLVREDVAPPVADDVRTLSDRLFRRLNLSRKVRRRISLSVTVDGVPDELWFDYRYDNGRPNLMQRVGLAGADKSTWDRLHLVETTFERLAESATFAEWGAVALVKEQDADPKLAQALRGRLAELAAVVDVSDEKVATEHLAKELRLPGHDSAV